MSTTFGKFSSFEKFIDSFHKLQVENMLKSDTNLSLAARRRRRRQTPGIVEVEAVIRERESDDTDGAKHYRLLITLTEIIESSPEVDEDVQDNLHNKTDVFVAIRFGDRLGIIGAIPGLDAGANLKLRGQWITKENADNHGGRPMSVLHFTHHPVGFICVEDTCFS